MGCSASQRLTAQLNLTREEVDQLKRDIKNSAELRLAIETELVKVRGQATSMTSDNERLKHDLILKAGDGGALTASVFESAKEEQERFKTWVRLEVREGNGLLSAIVKMRGVDETGTTARELKKQMDALELADYAVDRLKEFSVWKYKQTRLELEGLMDDRATWITFLQSYEDELRSLLDQTNREHGIKVRSQLAEISARLSRLPSAAQPLSRLKALRELEKQLCSLRINSASDVDSETKTQINKQAEEVKQLTQRLAAQRKMEEERKSAAEKELSLKEVHIKHLENKVKDLSRPSIADSEMKAKDREFERLKADLLKTKEATRAAQELLETAKQTNEDLQQRVQESSA